MIAKWSSPVGVEENQNLVEFSFYPNPFSSQANLEIKGNQDLKYNFRMSDLVGKEVINRPVEGSHIEISRGDLAAGIYFASIYTENRMVATRKIVIQ